MNIFFRKIKNRFYWLVQNIKFYFLIKINNKSQNKLSSDYSIGVTTFMDRYDSYFTGLLTRLSYLFPDKQILVAVNGHVKKEAQKQYLEKIKDFILQFGNVFLITYNQPKGLSKLWNELVKKMDSSKILMLNDDLKISTTFRYDLEDSGLLHEKIAVINKSWAHFFISKEVIELVGWFDENLLEIGGEDDDYLARLATHNIYPNSFEIRSIKNYSAKLTSNSFGKDMTGEYPYSLLNTKYLFNKWHITDHPSKGAVFSRGKYWQLKGNTTISGFN